MAEVDFVPVQYQQEIAVNDAITQMDRRDAYGATQHEQAMTHAFGAIAELLAVVVKKDETIASLLYPAPSFQRKEVRQ